MKPWVVALLAGLLVWMLCAVMHDAKATDIQDLQGIASPGVVMAHNEQIIHCNRNITYDRADYIGERENENGTLSEFYDTNGDEKVDIETLSFPTGYDDRGEMTHNVIPFMWIVDLNYDEIPDKEYIDIGQPPSGSCDEIKFYRDLSDPKAPWPDPDNGRREGTL